MMFKPCWPWRKRSAIASSAEPKPTYRYTQRRIRPRLEALEDRTLPSVSATVVQTAFQSVVQNVQNSVTSALGSVSLPLVANQLSAGLNGLVGLLDNQLGSSPSLNDAGPDYQFPIHAQIQKNISFDLGLGANLLKVAPGSPDAGDKTTVAVQLDFYYVVHFSYAISQINIEAPTMNVSDFPGQGSLPKTTFAVTLGVTLPGFNAAASLNGFLFARATDHAASPTSFTAAFGVNPPDPNSGSFSGMSLQGNAHIDLDLDLYLADPIKYPNLPINPHLHTEFVLDWNFDTSSASTLDPTKGGFDVQFKDLRLDVAGLIPGFLQDVIHDVKRVTEPLQPIVDVVNQEIPGLDTIGIHKADGSPYRIRDLLPDAVAKAADAIGFINSLPDFTHTPGDPKDPWQGYIDFGSFNLTGFGQKNSLGQLIAQILPAGTLDTAADLLKDATSIVGGFGALPTSTDALAFPPPDPNNPPEPPVGFAFPIITDPAHCVTELLLGHDPALFTYRLPTINIPKGISLGVNIIVAELDLNAFINLNINVSVGYDASGLIRLVQDISSGAIGKLSAGDAILKVTSDLIHGFYVDNTPVWVPPATFYNVSFPGYWQYRTGLDIEGGISASAGLLGLTISGGLTAQGSLHLDPKNEDTDFPNLHRIHLDKILDQITTDPLSLFAATGNISFGLDISYGFDTPFGSITLFSKNIAHVTIYDFQLGRGVPAATTPPPANTILLHMTTADETIYVHNFRNIRPVDGNFYDERDGIEVDYNAQPDGHTPTPPEFYYTQRITDEISGTRQTYYSNADGTGTVGPINLIATDKVADGNHTIVITGATYVYNGPQPNANNLTTKDGDGADDGGLFGGGENGSPDTVNAVLVGGGGNDHFVYHGAGRAILIGGGGDNYLEGGIREFGGNIPAALWNPPFAFTIPVVVNSEIQSQFQSASNPPAVGNDTLIGTTGDDIMVGSGGTNHFDGLGGNDTMYGGAGNDQFRVDAGYSGSPSIFGGGGNDSLAITDVPAIQFFTPDPTTSVDIGVHANPNVRDLSGQQALVINFGAQLIGGPAVQAFGISTLGITSYGGPISIQDLNSTSVKAVAIDSHSNAVTPVSVTVNGTAANDTFALSIRGEFDGSNAARVDEGSGALPIVVAGLTSVDSLSVDGGAGNNQLVLKNTLGHTTLDFSGATSGTLSDTGLNVSYLNFSRITDNATGFDHTLTLAGGYRVGYRLSPFTNETVSYSFSTGYTIQLDSTTITTKVGLINDLANASNVSFLDDLTSASAFSFTGASDEFLNLSDGAVVSGQQTTNVSYNFALDMSLLGKIRLLSPTRVNSVKQAKVPLTQGQKFALTSLAAPSYTSTSTTTIQQPGANFLIFALGQVNFANKTNVKVTEGWNSALDTRVAADGLSTLRIEPGDNHVAVQSTAAGVAVTLAKTVAGKGTEYDIGSFRPGVGVQDVRGLINITDTIPNRFNTRTTETLDGTTLTVDDSQDPVGHYAAIGGTIHDLAPADIRFADAAGMGPVWVYGGSGGNTFAINTVRAETLHLNSGSGKDTILVSAYVTKYAFTLYLDGGAPTRPNIPPTGGDYLELLSFQASTLGSAGGTLVNGHYANLLYVGRVSVFYIDIEGVFHDKIGQVGVGDLSGEGSTGGSSGQGEAATVLLRYDPKDPTLLQETINNVVQFDEPFTNLRNLTIDTGLGRATVNIEDLPAGLNLLVVELGSAYVNLGKAGSVQSLQGNISVINPLNLTTLGIDNSADTTKHNVVITNSTITGLAPGTIAFEQFGLDALTIHTGAGAGSVMVLGTPSNGAGTILGHTDPGVPDVTTLISIGGPQAVTVGSKGSLQGIQGHLDLETLAAGATVTVDDSKDTAKQAVLLNKPDQTATYQVAGLTLNPIRFSITALDSLTLNGGSADNTYDVRSTPAGVAVTLNTGGGQDATNVGSTGNTLADMAGALTVNGVRGRGTLAVNDQGASAISTYVVTAGTITRTGAAPIAYTAVSGVVLDTAAGNNTTNVQGTSAGTTMTVITGSGTDLVNVGDSENVLDGVQGALTVDGAAGKAALAINDQGGSAVANYTVTSAVVTRTGAAPITYAFMTSLVLNTAAGRNTIDVQTTDGNTPVTVNTGTGPSTVNVGTPDDKLRGIATLTVNGGTLRDAGGNPVAGGATTLNLDDQANTVGINLSSFLGPISIQTQPTYVVSDHSVIRSDALTATYLRSGASSSATIISTIDYSNLAGLTVNGGTTHNIFNVQSTAADTPTTINAGAATDTVNVGDPNNTIDGLLGPLTVNGQKNTLLNVNDQGTTADKTYSLTSTSLVRTDYPPGVAGGQAITYSKAGTLVINGGSGNNLFGVTGTVAGTAVTLNGGTANSDQFVLGDNNSLDSIQGALAVHGQTAYSFLVLSDLLNTAAHTYTLTSSKLQRGNRTRGKPTMADISYDGLDQFVLYGGRGSDIFNVSSTFPATPVVIVANSSTATFNIGATVHNVTTSIAAP